MQCKKSTDASLVACLVLATLLAVASCTGSPSRGTSGGPKASPTPHPTPNPSPSPTPSPAPSMDARASMVLVATADGAGTIYPLASPACTVRSSEPSTNRYQHDFHCTFSGLSAPVTARIVETVSGALHEYDASVLSLPGEVAVEKFRFEWDAPQSSTPSHVIFPAWEGFKFDEPAVLLQGQGTLSTSLGHSVQAVPFWTDQGDAVLTYAADPSGMEIKFFTFRAEVRASTPVFVLGVEHQFPNTDHGGMPVRIPYPIRRQVYRGDWYDGAKLYRQWATTTPLLSLGKLEGRSDIPRWFRETDLILTDDGSWYPGPGLMALQRIKTELPVDQVLFFMWGWTDSTSLLGTQGTYFPKPGLALDVQTLQASGIRFMGYTLPSAFYPANPAFTGAQAIDHTLRNRQNQVSLYLDTLALMDLTDSWWTTYLGNLAAYHAVNSHLSGFYNDNPGFIAERWNPGSLPHGLTRQALAGYCDIMRQERSRARQVGVEFITLHEASYERLIACADGEGGTGTYVSLLPGAHDRARGVPFFQTIYHDYTPTLITSEFNGPASLGAYGDAYELGLSRVTARGFAYGNVLDSSEMLLREGKLNSEITAADLGGADPWPLTLHYVPLLRELIQTKKRARAWLTYGEMLRDPAIDGDRTTVRLASGTFTEFKLATSAFRANDGRIAVIAVNGGGDRASIVVDVAKLGLLNVTSLEDVSKNLSFPVLQGKATISLDPIQAALLLPRF